MIQLTKTEVQLVKLCKGHYNEKFPFTGEWTDTLKPWFIEVYGWNPDDGKNYQNYLFVMFDVLLGTHMKIQDDGSGTNLQLRNLFYVSFNKSISRSQELPIERVISELCGLIQSNLYLVNIKLTRAQRLVNYFYKLFKHKVKFENKKPRYNLED